jgi:hypothetical protein
MRRSLEHGHKEAGPNVTNQQSSERSMSTLALILLARAVHVLGGVFWAGSTLLMTWVVFPIGARHAAQGGASWLDEIRRKAGPMAGISAQSCRSSWESGCASEAPSVQS